MSLVLLSTSILMISFDLVGGASPAGRSIQLDDVFAAVCGVADEPLADGVDDEVQVFQGKLADQDGAILGEFDDGLQAVTTLDRQADGLVDLHGHGPRARPSGSGPDGSESQLLDQT